MGEGGGEGGHTLFTPTSILPHQGGGNGWGAIFIVRGDEPVATDYTILPTVLMYITFKRILARQDQVRIVIELKRFFIAKIVKGTFWNTHHISYHMSIDHCCFKMFMTQ